MFDIWLATFDNLLSFLYLHVRATSMMSYRVALWSDKVQAGIKKLLSSMDYTFNCLITH